MRKLYDYLSLIVLLIYVGLFGAMGYFMAILIASKNIFLIIVVIATALCMIYMIRIFIIVFKEYQRYRKYQVKMNILPLTTLAIGVLTGGYAFSILIDTNTIGIDIISMMLASLISLVYFVLHLVIYKKSGKG